MTNPSYLTHEGLDKLNEKLDYLKNVKRKEITKRIEEAIKLGDLSENAEYHEAKDDQGMNEAKIREIEGILKNAEVVETVIGKKTYVSVGSTIEVKINNDKQKFTIVDPAEANPAEGLISNESPLGQAFMNKKIGEIVDVEVPAGLINYKILKIE